VTKEGGGKESNKRNPKENEEKEKRNKRPIMDQPTTLPSAGQA
jgi:hypothetical protein